MGIVSKEKQKSVWISTTGYRIFLELKSLIEAPRSVKELMEIVKNDCHYAQKHVSIDTIRFDIFTLKSAGCNILRPTKANNFKYQLVSHPFVLNITPQELDILFELRDYLSSDISLNEVFVLNGLYDKIASLTYNSEIIEEFKNTKLLADINQDIVKEFSNPNIMRKKVQITYNSPKYGIEDTDIIPVKLIYDDKKVYVTAYNYKYKRISYFEISKILKINSVSMHNQEIPEQRYTVVYEVNGSIIKEFELKSYEKIIEKTEEKIVVEAEVTSEFMFIQRLFLLGKNFKIISPDIFREKLITKINLIQKRYTNA